MPTEADNIVSHEEADNSNEKPVRKTEARRKKRMRAQGSQTDDEAKPLVMVSDTSMAAGCATRS